MIVIINLDVEKSLICSKLGNVEIKTTYLVNNYYYDFVYGEFDFNLRHVLNVYGSSCNFWDLTIDTCDKSFCLSFNNLNEVLDFIIKVTFVLGMFYD